jgi:hypothetical protein
LPNLPCPKWPSTAALTWCGLSSPPVEFISIISALGRLRRPKTSAAPCTRCAPQLSPTAMLKIRWPHFSNRILRSSPGVISLMRRKKPGVNKIISARPLEWVNSPIRYPSPMAGMTLPSPRRSTQQQQRVSAFLMCWLKVSQRLKISIFLRPTRVISPCRQISLPGISRSLTVCWISNSNPLLATLLFPLWS